MKKSIVFTLLLASALTTGCSCNKEDGSNASSGGEQTPTVETNYKVTKEQYEDLCYTKPYLNKINSLNFRTIRKESTGNENYQYVTEFDNGKVKSSSQWDDFYVYFKPGTYNEENRTFSYDYYYQDEGQMKKTSFENEGIPDDIFLPDLAFIISYDELKFNEETNFYEQVPEEKVLNMYEHYTEIKIKFIDGKFSYASWKCESRTTNGKTWSCSLEADEYGKTSVSLPNV